MKKILFHLGFKPPPPEAQEPHAEMLQEFLECPNGHKLYKDAWRIRQGLRPNGAVGTTCA